MNIKKIEIKNFRLLRDFSIDLENQLSLVLGKNNTGKTSFLSALDKFINSSDKNRISFDDFNIDLKSQLVKIIKSEVEVDPENDYSTLGLSLKLFVEYGDTDDLSQVRKLIMSLDPGDHHIVLAFEYLIDHASLLAMKAEYLASKDKYDNDASLFIKERHRDYFGAIKRKSLSFSDHEIFTDLIKENISLDGVISFKYISAKRSVTNKDNDKTLSSQTAALYKKTVESKEQEATVEKFKKALRDTDKDLSGIYKNLFSGLLEKVARFGGTKASETQIKIASTLQHRELLDGNTTVMYTHDTHDLPEHFNGLGYMNLISMIFEIEMLMTAFRRANDERPAALNLLFIEEPEAHTHPQMQYVFIKNIKALLQEGRLREDKVKIHLQTIISTHSSHIVAESDFDDIKYLRRSISENVVNAKSLRLLQDEYEKGAEDTKETAAQHYRFLKQYLTLNRAELFFADKVIFIEGDTERILLPAMMWKLDTEYPDKDCVPLLSQNISIVEVGAHSQVFEKFIHFVGIKALILTDLDSGKTVLSINDDGTPKVDKHGEKVTETEKCSASDANADHTTNGALIFYHSKTRKDLPYFKDLKIDGKVLSKTDGKWSIEVDGYVLLAYQTQEDEYHGRSFEDSFFAINKEFLGTDPSKFPSLTAKWFNKFVSNACDAFTFAENGVGKKTSFAIEILMNSASKDTLDYSGWKTPHYIREGLEWLRK